MWKTTLLLVLGLATPGFSGQIDGPVRGMEDKIGASALPPGPYAKSFEVQGPSGGTQIRGYSDGFGGYYLTGPSGGPVGQIRGDGTLVGPSGGYEGRIDVR